MAKKKATTKAQPGNLPEPSAHVTGRLDQVLQFPAGWDQHKLSDTAIDGIREYLRDFHGAENIKTAHHFTSHKIEGKATKHFTALFFAHTTTEGELVADGVTIPPRKGQLVILPANTEWKVKATLQRREIIEFTF